MIALAVAFVVWFSAATGYDSGEVTARTCAAAEAAAHEVARNAGLTVVSVTCEGCG